jgi:hypothetical protein
MFARSVFSIDEYTLVVLDIVYCHVIIWMVCCIGNNSNAPVDVVLHKEQPCPVINHDIEVRNDITRSQEGKNPVCLACD